MKTIEVNRIRDFVILCLGEIAAVRNKEGKLIRISCERVGV